MHGANPQLESGMGWQKVVAQVRRGADLGAGGLRAAIQRLAEKELNPRQLRAWKAIALEKKNVFVTGNAGATDTAA